MATLASKTGLNQELQVDAANRAQNNLDGLNKIINGVISKSEQGTDDVLPGKAKYQKFPTALKHSDDVDSSSAFDIYFHLFP